RSLSADALALLLRQVGGRRRALRVAVRRLAKPDTRISAFGAAAPLWGTAIPRGCLRFSPAAVLHDRRAERSDMRVRSRSPADKGSSHDEHHPIRRPVAA